MMVSLRTFVASAFWLAATVQTENEDEEQAPIWFDNVGAISYPDNIVMVPWKPLKDRYDDPDLFDSLEHDGYDWTQPFPGSKLDSGFHASLRVVDGIPLPADLGGFNETTALSSIKHSIPASLMDGDMPKKMDASWTVCRHYFITTNVADTQGDHECAFIPEQCREDLIKELTEDWLTEEQITACSRMTPDPIPESCWKDLGFSRQIMFRKKSFDNEVSTRILGLGEPDSQDWHLGSGFNSLKTNLMALQKTARRTHIIATAWGYSAEADEGSRTTPEVTFACLRAQEAGEGNASSETSSDPEENGGCGRGRVVFGGVAWTYICRGGLVMRTAFGVNTA